VVKHRAEGKTFKEAGILAGYPEKNAAQSAYQAMQGLRGRVSGLLDQAGLSEEIAIEKYLNQHPRPKRQSSFRRMAR
jgi:hypothetical protein